MAAAKKDAVVDATRMQSDQKNAELKAAYIKAREKALAENPNLLGTSIPEWTPGMNLDAAWKTLSFATGGQGNANAGVRQRSSLDRTVEPWNPLAECLQGKQARQFLTKKELCQKNQFHIRIHLIRTQEQKKDLETHQHLS